MNQYKDQPLTAGAAAARLGVKRATLYAYVSRGRLRSVAVPGSRERHYLPQDIDALRAGRGGPAQPQPRDDTAMPVIDSAICLIENGRLYYRGRDAIRLSDSAPLEDIAALLWGDYPAEAAAHAAAAPPRRPAGTPADGDAGDIIVRCQLRLAALAAADPAPAASSRPALLRTGQRILHEIVGCVAATPRAAPRRAVHRRLTAHWRLDPPAGDVVRRALVLLADHELNPSTFAARVVASTGASLYAAVSAALGALSGPRHGGAAAQVEALFHAARAEGDPIDIVVERLARGESLPGIGHPLYPDGDPRAVAILYALSLMLPQARRLVGRQPNVDFALGAASALLGLPAGAALAIFIVARTVGWIAHAIEQYESGVPIRPRARYTGPLPA